MEHDTTQRAALGDAPQQWRRIRLVKTFLILLIPVVVLTLVSYLLWRAIAQSTPENFEDIHFWFYFFDVGREINVPTWFSAGLWSVIGLITGYYARSASRFRVSWGFFSFIAFFLSLDETLELHERLDVIGAEMATYLPVDLGFTWVLPGVLIAMALCAFLVRLMLSLPGAVKLGLLASGAVFVSGAVGVETLSGLVLAEQGFAPSFFVLTLIEETLEMAGLALAVASLLHVLEYRRIDGGTAYRPATDRLPPSPAPAPPTPTRKTPATRDGTEDASAPSAPVGEAATTIS